MGGGQTNIVVWLRDLENFIYAELVKLHGKGGLVAFGIGDDQLRRLVGNARRFWQVCLDLVVAPICDVHSQRLASLDLRAQLELYRHSWRIRSERAALNDD